MKRRREPSVKFLPLGIFCVFMFLCHVVEAAVPSGFTKLSGVKKVSAGVCSIVVKLESPSAEHIADADIIEAEFKGDEMAPLVISIEPLVGMSAGSALAYKAGVTLRDFRQGKSVSVPFVCENAEKVSAAYGVFVCVISKFDNSAQRCADAYAVDMGRRSQDVRVAALSDTIDLPSKLFLLKDGAPDLGGSKTYFFGALFRDTEGSFYIPPEFAFQDRVEDVRKFLAAGNPDSKLTERVVFKGSEMERAIGSYPMESFDGGDGLIVKLPHSQ